MSKNKPQLPPRTHIKDQPLEKSKPPLPRRPSDLNHVKTSTEPKSTKKEIIDKIDTTGNYLNNGIEYGSDKISEKVKEYFEFFKF